MEFKPIEKECKCGNVVVVDRQRVWCTECAKPVYYKDKEQKKHTINSVYMGFIILCTVLFLAYIFIEMIVRPLTS
ncbi:MAG: hypothetical protein V1793_17050 [Pseudomonadota bacterium]